MSTVLVEELGVVLVRNALSEQEQKDLWAQVKPRVQDPKGRATGFSGFSVSTKDDPPEKRVPEFDAVGEKLYRLAAARLIAAAENRARIRSTRAKSATVGSNTTAADKVEEQVVSIDNEEEEGEGAEEVRLQEQLRVLAGEPSYKHLLEMQAEPERPINMGQLFGNYYRPETTLMNHCDSDQILFTMSLSLGDSVEFIIGKPTGRTGRMSERKCKKVHKLTLRSGDAVFFDGGLVPHEVGKITPKSAPKWWDADKVPNGSRCVVLFRQKEQDFYQERLIKKKK